ncbi:nucleoside recognition domain-containing protein [Halegenticoccus tardaugens]|uniref:nucleoside recognition domain-containing protein n=1 Tax=Halegenticoccus tardaugens TaxID=2071624 RepID=UPI00100AE7E7|nr:nucleoside recognition domain-containing protein [Halegenticoccus tardaugens]
MDDRRDVVVVGTEAVGKSSLVSSLAGGGPTSGNFRGTTVRSEAYPAGAYRFVDTPGIAPDADTATTREALARLDAADLALLVVPATDPDRDLYELLPLVEGKAGAVVVTFWDAVEASADAREAIEELREDLGVPVVPVDARSVGRIDEEPVRVDGGGAVGRGGGGRAGDGGATDRRGDAVCDSDGRDGADRIRRALERADSLPGGVGTSVGWRIEPPKTALERPYLGPPLCALALLLPAVAAVLLANGVAAGLDPAVETALRPAVDGAASLPGPLRAALAGDYGLLAMGPFLFVWAGPTMLVFAAFTGAYKASGLLARLTAALDPYTRRVGLTGHDLVRVVMGFGCNVPAVVGTRSCSDCTRCTTVSAIAFGSACSYQFPATLAVFAAVGTPWLVGPYLVVLAATTLVYLRLIAPAEARRASPVAGRRAFLTRPSARAVGREAWGSIRGFFRTALPVFACICVVAALLDRIGAIDALGEALGPVAGAFGLPPEVALVVVLASIRKDGIALLAADGSGGALVGVSPLGVLVAVYLAGTFLPCLVTAFTVATEVSPRYAATLLCRQALAALAFSFVIARGGEALFAVASVGVVP